MKDFNNMITKHDLTHTYKTYVTPAEYLFYLSDIKCLQKSQTITILKKSHHTECNQTRDLNNRNPGKFPHAWRSQRRNDSEKF